MMYSNDWGWGAWLMMMIFMLAFWGLVAWVVVTLMRRSSDTNTAGPQDSAEDILAKRLARGELDEDEYTRRLDRIRSQHSNHARRS